MFEDYLSREKLREGEGDNPPTGQPTPTHTMQRQSDDNQAPKMQMPQPVIPKPVVTPVNTAQVIQPSMQERSTYPAAGNFVPGEKRASMTQPLSAKSQRSEGEERLRELRKEHDEALEASNNLIGFIGTIAVFIASVSVSMLSFAHDKFADRDDPEGRTSDHVIYALFYVSVCLALTPAALCIITHSRLLEAITHGLISKGERRQIHENEDIQRNLLEEAIKKARSYDDALFWVGWFVFPSVLTLIAGLALLAWADHAQGVAIAMTIVLGYCSAHVARLLLKLAIALYHGRNK